MTHELPQDSIQSQEAQREERKRQQIQQIETELEGDRQQLIDYLTPPEKATPKIRAVYDTRKKVIEDRRDETREQGFAEGRAKVNVNLYKVRGRIEGRCQELGAALPGGYLYEMRFSEQLTDPIHSKATRLNKLHNLSSGFNYISFSAELRDILLKVEKQKEDAKQKALAQRSEAAKMKRQQSQEPRKQ